MNEENVISYMGNGLLAFGFCAVVIGCFWFTSKDHREMEKRRRTIRTHYQRMMDRQVRFARVNGVIQKGGR